MSWLDVNFNFGLRKKMKMKQKEKIWHSELFSQVSQKDEKTENKI